jgi:S-adenosylmethionine:tRNA ribosyltransferase-isomerase
MNDPREISITDYSYELPEDRIAQHPLADRDASKLLVYREGKITERIFSAIPEEIPPASLLVFNKTRVVRARILMQRKSGAAIEIFCTDSANSSIDFVSALQAQGEVTIRAFVGNAKRWKQDEVLELFAGGTRLLAKKIVNEEDQWLVHLSWTPAERTFAEILDAAGKIPLPPYLNREEEPGDAERYQTVYAEKKGSVAAPTAGLHFTENVLQILRKKNVRTEQVTLHVGAGTFKPVKTERMSGHEMHREQVFIPLSLVEKLVAPAAPVIAVGTTAMRTLESLYWFGRSMILNPGRHFDSLYVSQWEPYESGPDVPVPVAMRAVCDWMKENNRAEIYGYTQILIAPGYKFRLCNALITNFHQPRSTLLLLVAAFIGDDFRKVYDYALAHDFRFLSYGDSSLLWRKE